MAFNSLEYAVFLALFLCAHYGLGRTFAIQRLLVIVASAVFYAFWSPAFLVHFFAVVWLTYAASLWMEAAATANAKRAILWIAISANLANLGFWKYAGFAVETVSWLLTHLGMRSVPLRGPQLVLPLAISFYTFHAISYLVDLYRHHPHSRPRNLLDFLFYIVMFPHQVAGPILRGHELFPQLEHKPLRGQELSAGLTRILIGLFQKSVIADNLAIAADHGFRYPTELSAGEAYVVLLAYTFQIFFDFAGYTNMGIGSARLLGYRLPENFDAPYLSADISEFWRRWHMTLSRWIRDYIFIPLGGSRGSELATSCNLMITMGLAGLWHGASWTFVAWGLYHGAGLVVHRGWRASGSRAALVRAPLPRLGRAVALLATFHFVALGWVLFRAPDFGTALRFYDRLWQGLTGHLAWSVEQAYIFKTYGFTAMLLYGLGIAATRVRGLRAWLDQSWEVRAMAWGIVLCVILLLTPRDTAPFIYFQF
jgi:alginate O-acetyltransferase complex protein AlgI